MSVLPSPLKSPTCTSTQVTAVDQRPHMEVVNPEEPLESATHQLPVAASRPTTSGRPSPLKSPTCTSTQVLLGSQAPYGIDMKPLDPLETATVHWPVWLLRPTMSSQ